MARVFLELKEKADVYESACFRFKLKENLSEFNLVCVYVWL